jgi:hypothetical protein
VHGESQQVEGDEHGGQRSIGNFVFGR